MKISRITHTTNVVMTDETLIKIYTHLYKTQKRYYLKTIICSYHSRLYTSNSNIVSKVDFYKCACTFTQKWLHYYKKACTFTIVRALIVKVFFTIVHTHFNFYNYGNGALHREMPEVWSAVSLKSPKSVFTSTIVRVLYKNLGNFLLRDFQNVALL